jgi:hypothetical protein
MASHYTKEKSKYGTLTGSIIIWPVEIPVPNNPQNPDVKNILPAGYLRCDGSKYNASQYPDLAAICGTGTNCKFVRKDQNNNALTVLTNEEFVVPDLGSKYPRPVPGGDAGTYNNILTETQSGTFIKRSGIGVEATSNVGTVATVTYSGKFIIPPQTIKLKGKPGYTWGNSGYTDSEAVDSLGVHPHMHFSTTNRVRIKPRNSPVSGQDLAFGQNHFANATTINVTDWLNATKYNEGGLSNNSPGSNQPACWAIASGTKSSKADVITIVPLPPPLFFGSTLESFTNFCRSGCDLSNLRCYCLLSTAVTYELQRDWFGFRGTRQKNYVDSLIGCVPNLFDGGSDGYAWPTNGTTPATYISGAAQVPNDWKGTSLSDVLPLNSNLTSQTAFPQANNIVTEVDELQYTEGINDPTVHNHKITLEKTDHTFKIVTDTFLLEPDALNTTIGLFPETEASLDAVTSPFIILEYLIKT